jgi:ATP-dependent protease ClpP protease subunit
MDQQHSPTKGIKKMATGLVQPTPHPPQQPPQVVYISFSAEINVKTCESLIAAMANCANQKVPEVYLMMSTPGGLVMNGMNLYNVLRGMPFRLTTHNVGNVDSIGNAVFLAGAQRYACPHSTFMFHGVGFDIQNGTRFEERKCRETLSSILAEHKRIGTVIRERTNLQDRAIRSLFREAQTKDSTFAVSSGIVHEVRDVQIPPGAPIVSLVFQR